MDRRRPHRGAGVVREIRRLTGEPDGDEGHARGAGHDPARERDPIGERRAGDARRQRQEGAARSTPSTIAQARALATSGGRSTPAPCAGSRSASLGLHVHQRTDGRHVETQRERQHRHALEARRRPGPAGGAEDLDADEDDGAVTSASSCDRSRTIRRRSLVAMVIGRDAGATQAWRRPRVPPPLPSRACRRAGRRRRQRERARPRPPRARRARTAGAAGAPSRSGHAAGAPAPRPASTR